MTELPQTPARPSQPSPLCRPPGRPTPPPTPRCSTPPAASWPRPPPRPRNRIEKVSRPGRVRRRTAAARLDEVARGLGRVRRGLLPGPPPRFPPLGPAPAHHPGPRPSVRPGRPPDVRLGCRLRGRPRPGRLPHRARPDPRGPRCRPVRPLHPAHSRVQEGTRHEGGGEGPEGGRGSRRAPQEGAQGPQPGPQPAGRCRLRPAAGRDRRRLHRHRLARCCGRHSRDVHGRRVRRTQAVRGGGRLVGRLALAGRRRPDDRPDARRCVQGREGHRRRRDPAHRPDADAGHPRCLVGGHRPAAGHPREEGDAGRGRAGRRVRRRRGTGVRLQARPVRADRALRVPRPPVHGQGQAGPAARAGGRRELLGPDQHRPGRSRTRHLHLGGGALRPDRRRAGRRQVARRATRSCSRPRSTRASSSSSPTGRAAATWSRSSTCANASRATPTRRRSTRCSWTRSPT